jgi:hypothetical protein
MSTYSEEAKQTGKHVNRKWLRRIVFGTLAMCVGALIGAFAVYRSLQWVPQFYQQELSASKANQTAGDQQMAQQMLELLNDFQGGWNVQSGGDVQGGDMQGGDMQDEGQWEATFSDDEINGWLAVDFKKEFPRLLPHRIYDPRISISEQAAQIACQYKSTDLTVVVSMDVDAFVTDEPNVIGFRVQRARIGAVPGLEKMAKDEITRAARRSRIKLRWTRKDGDDVAMITIPNDAVLEGHQVLIETIELHDGAVHLAGRSLQIAADESATVQVTARQDKASLSKRRQL